MAKKAAAATSKVIVTIQDSHLGELKSLTKSLRNAGLEIGQILETSGIISGEVAEVNVAALRQIEGVQDVEPDSDMHAI